MVIARDLCLSSLLFSRIPFMHLLENLSLPSSLRPTHIYISVSFVRFFDSILKTQLSALSRQSFKERKPNYRFTCRIADFPRKLHNRAKSYRGTSIFRIVINSVHGARQTNKNFVEESKRDKTTLTSKVPKGETRVSRCVYRASKYPRREERSGYIGEKRRRNESGE